MIHSIMVLPLHEVQSTESWWNQYFGNVEFVGLYLVIILIILQKGCTNNTSDFIDLRSMT